MMALATEARTAIKAGEEIRVDYDGAGSTAMYDRMRLDGLTVEQLTGSSYKERCWHPPPARQGGSTHTRRGADRDAFGATRELESDDDEL